MDKKVIVITGASSGIGLETAKLFAQKGYKVYGIGRSKFETNDPNFCYLQGDVCDEKTMKEIADQIYKTEGHIDILYNNAGMGISGAIEFVEKEKVQKIFEVNIISQVLLSKIYIPYLRETKGKIIFTSSVAAPAAIPLQACYSATKAAIESFALSLAKELRSQKIKVACVRPGDIKTGFTAAREKNEKTNQAYGEMIKDKTNKMEKCENNGMPPIKVAKHVWKIAKRKNPPLISTVGFGYKCVSGLIKILPAKWSNYLVYKFY